MVRCRSSLLAEYSIARTASAISSPASGTNDVHAEDLIVIARRDELGEAAGLFHGARPAAGQERKHPDLVVAAARLHLLLGEPHPGDLGGGVDDRGDDLVVHLPEAAGDQVGDHDALFLALVRQHRSAHAVPDRPDALGAGATVVIHLDEAALVELDARARGQQVLGVRAAADGDHHAIDRETLLALGVAVSDLHRRARGRAPVTLAPRRISSPCFLKCRSASFATC